MKCNSIDFCLDYCQFMRNFRIPQVFTLIPQTVCLRIVYAEFER